MDANHRVWAEIDLDALAHNLAEIRRRAGASSRVLLVVKADAYGHGAVVIARHAERCGVAGFGVGTGAEALELRAAGIRAPILVLGALIEAEVEPVLRADVEIALHATDRLRSLEKTCARLGVRAGVHLNVDTGLGRLGVRSERALELLDAVREARALQLRGAMTHLAAATGAGCPTATEQLGRFTRFLSDAGPRLGSAWVHGLSSSALFHGVQPRFDTIRPGIAAFGMLPRGVPEVESLRPVLSLRSQIVFLKDVEEGTPIGYGSTWRAPNRTRIATLPIGYDDGLPWRVGSTGRGAHVLVRGRRVPVVGRVSMDYATIDVGSVPGASVGDPVTIVGRDGDELLRVEDLAQVAGTIPYEVTCSLGKRVARLVRGGEDVELPARAPEPGVGRPLPDAAELSPHGT